MNLISSNMLNNFSAKELINQGSIKFQEGDEEAAIQDYSRAIEFDPDYLVAYYNRGLAFSSIFEPERATRDFSKVIEIDPNYSDAYHHRGIARFELGDNQGAIEDFTKAASFDSYKTRSYAYKPLNYSYRAAVFLDLGEKESAMKDFQKAADLYLEMGMIQAHKNTLDKIQEIKKS